MITSQLLKYAKQRRDPFRIEYPHHLIRRGCRIGKWSQQIKYGAHSDFPARRDDMFHGAVMRGGKHEAHTHLFDGASDLIRP